MVKGGALVDKVLAVLDAHSIYGNSFRVIATAVLFIAGACFILKILQLLILKRLRRIAERTTNRLDDFIIDTIARIVMPSIYFGAFYAGLMSLTLPGPVEQGLRIAGLAVVTLIITRVMLAVLNYVFIHYWQRRGKDVAIEKSLSGILRVLSIIMWALAISLFLDNIGYKISAVITGLGIGGVAVALAAQTVLKDLFSYIAIILDRPFEIGDFIIIGDFMGTVDHIGIKTTRIMSLSGEQLVFSNTDLTNSRVRNYKRMEKRRVVFRLGVTYQTSLAQCQKIPVIIKTIIQGIADTTFDRAHFFSYGDFSLIYEIVYYVAGSDYNKYMDIQQEINFTIKEAFEKEGIEFAYPTQLVYVEKNN